MSASGPERERPAALVTGGAVRLGRRIALALAEEGFDLALHFHSSAEKAAETREEIVALGVGCRSFQADLGDAGAAVELAARVHRAFPRWRLLVNSASVYDQAPIRETTAELFDRQMAVNLRAPLLLLREFARRAGRGQAVNIIDNKIAFHQFDYAAYVLSKKALADFTRMAAAELGPEIRVNGLAPGVILPASSRKSDYITWREKFIPVRRKGEVEELMDGLLFLVRNDFVNGQILMVDGGESINLAGPNFAAWSE